MKNTKLPVLVVDDVSVKYGDARESAVENVTFSLFPGTITMLVGPNGSGKTTLIRAILGLLECTGKVTITGEVAFVTQRFEFDRSFPITVYELISLFLTRGGGVFSDKNRTMISSVLEKLKILELIDRQLSSLSGGQLQRVLLARALANNPKLLILDEPEAGVDAGAEQVFYDLIRDLAEKDNLTVLVSSHDLEVVYTYADEVICINRKMVCSGKPRAVLNQDTFNQLYGMNLKFYTHTHSHDH